MDEILPGMPEPVALPPERLDLVSFPQVTVTITLDDDQWVAEPDQLLDDGETINGETLKRLIEQAGSIRTLIEDCELLDWDSINVTFSAVDPERPHVRLEINARDVLRDRLNRYLSRSA
jgi:hypothetical protein